MTKMNENGLNMVFKMIKLTSKAVLYHLYQNIPPLFTINWPLFLKWTKNAYFLSKISSLFFRAMSSIWNNVPNVQHFFGMLRCCTLGATGVFEDSFPKINFILIRRFSLINCSLFKVSLISKNQTENDYDDFYESPRNQSFNHSVNFENTPTARGNPSWRSLLSRIWILIFIYISESEFLLHCSALLSTKNYLLNSTSMSKDTRKKCLIFVLIKKC